MSTAAYQAKHAATLQKLAAKGQRVTFTRTTRTPDPSTGILGAPTTDSVSGYALGLEEGDPQTYARLGLTLSAAPSLMVVCDTFGDVPMDNGRVEWGGVPHTVRDVLPFAPAGQAIFSTVVIER